MTLSFWWMTVGDVAESPGEFGLGWGYGRSTPLPPHGWQRAIRVVASHPPRITPCLWIAKMAYWEQVGENRHRGPSNGLTPR